MFFVVVIDALILLPEFSQFSVEWFALGNSTGFGFFGIWPKKCPTIRSRSENCAFFFVEWKAALEIWSTCVSQIVLWQWTILTCLREMLTDDTSSLLSLFKEKMKHHFIQDYYISVRRSSAIKYCFAISVRTLVDW